MTALASRRQGRRRPASRKQGTLATTELRSIEVDGRRLRVGIRRGRGTPLLICNGVGASLELLEPLTHALHGIETIVFDVPGVGGSERPLLPYTVWNLARLAARMLDVLGYSRVDVLGLSWGGALAQQFAHSFRKRCRRLILAATTPGVTMVPASLSVLSHLAHPRRYQNAAYLRRIAPELYGGQVRRDMQLIDRHSAYLRPPDLLGYLYQQLAFCAWSSLLWLPCIRQPTLVLAGRDDPLV
ncbi:MAG: phaB2, partial [Steroidobacteraceae bacterium]|nr:phaB2 [Steroidobacteraceae bacterium]